MFCGYLEWRVWASSICCRPLTLTTNSKDPHSAFDGRSNSESQFLYHSSLRWGWRLYAAHDTHILEQRFAFIDGNIEIVFEKRLVRVNRSRLSYHPDPIILYMCLTIAERISLSQIIKSKVSDVSKGGRKRDLTIALGSRRKYPPACCLSQVLSSPDCMHTHLLFKNIDKKA